VKTLARVLVVAIGASCGGCQRESSPILLEEEDQVGAPGQRPQPQEMAHSHPSEPVYEGKTLSDWVAEAKSDRVEARRAAAEALGSMGAPAVATLTELLRDQDMGVRLAAASALRKAKGEKKRE